MRSVNKVLSLLLLLAVLLGAAPAAQADIFPKPVTFSAGQVLPAASLNSDFDTIYNGVNGNLSNVNIKTAAAIDPAKMDLTKAYGPILRAAASTCFSAGNTGDTQPRCEITSDGKLKMGPGGSSAVDRILERVNTGGIAGFRIRNAANTAFLDIQADRCIAETNFAFSGSLPTATVFDGTQRFLMVETAGQTFQSASIYIASDQTITAAGALSLTHSLGRRPTFIKTFLVCQTGELGYTAADIVEQAPGYNGVANSGVSIVPTTTTLEVRYGSAATTFTIIRKDTGASAAATNANWKMRFIAF